MQNVRGAALMEGLEAGDHKSTARIGTSEKEFGSKEIVLWISPAQHTTWGQFYNTNSGIEQAFCGTLKHEISSNILSMKCGVSSLGLWSMRR